MIEFRDAIRDALAEEIERDPAVVFFGEDVAAPGGVFAVTKGLHERFGDERVFDTPISELALAGAAYGAAVTGGAAAKPTCPTKVWIENERPIRLGSTEPLRIA